jgi:alkanesulfonate monooxygenase SsuD/methylene tetrahydromethanopterin reductase-like flavin-dependent oxidoreductase (luciferase family)
MQFGVQFFPVVSPNDKSAAAYFAESIALAERAEKLGFTHARTVEHYFERYGGYSPNPIVFLSAIASRTKSIRLVTGAVLPVFNNPLKLAGEIGMLDAISSEFRLTSRMLVTAKASNRSNCCSRRRM